VDEEKKNKLALTSVLLGIISIIANLGTVIFRPEINIRPEINNNSSIEILFILLIISILFVILSIVLGVVSLKQIKEKKEKGKLLATLGIATGILSTIYNLVPPRTILGIFLIIITGMTLINTLLIIKVLKTKTLKDKIYVLISGVVTIVIILFIYFIFFIYLNPSPPRPDWCTSTAGIECKSYDMDLSDNRMSLAFVNNLGYPITINNVNISHKGVLISRCDAPGQITDIKGLPISTTNLAQPDDMFLLRNCTLITSNTSLSEKRKGDKVKFDFSFNYVLIDENESPRLAYGTVSATVR